MKTCPVNIAIRNLVHHDEIIDTEQYGRHWAQLCLLKAVLQICLLHNIWNAFVCKQTHITFHAQDR
jgi:hypothetical protein